MGNKGKTILFNEQLYQTIRFGHFKVSRQDIGVPKFQRRRRGKIKTKQKCKERINLTLEITFILFTPKSVISVQLTLYVSRLKIEPVSLSSPSSSSLSSESTFLAIIISFRSSGFKSAKCVVFILLTFSTSCRSSITSTSS